MAARTSTKTVTTDVQEVDVDNDGDIDATVQHTTTITIEDEDCEPPVEPPNGPGAQADPDACGETACWTRTPVAFTDSAVGLTATLTPGWKGNIAWDFGDGSDVMVGRGPVTHTYGIAGTYTVTASPIASACLKSGSAGVTV